MAKMRCDSQRSEGNIFNIASDPISPLTQNKLFHWVINIA